MLESVKLPQKTESNQPSPRPPSLLSQTKQLLRQSGLRARKGLAQHFLVDGGILHSIISAADLAPSDIVLEVGPGLGVLTRELARKAGFVIAVELDSNLVAILKQNFSSFDNISIVEGDILKIDLATLLASQRQSLPPTITGPSSYKVVADLPYYITSHVLRHFLEAQVKPRLMVLMVQKEVAQSIVAEPGDMSMLSVSVQFYGRPRIVKYVPARSFYPAPDVDSAILRIDLYPQPAVDVTDNQGFFDLVRAGFCAARKQIANSLSQGLKLPKSEILPLLESAGIESKRRAETLTLDEWARLWHEFTRVGEAA
ncbi:MAG: ribosomal RNA small subunit methyltransferase A [Chloroflexi bacterium]|nr:ribosomal RNA small subunit methyltransferase A [Chloroflexota bacterium]